MPKPNVDPHPKIRVTARADAYIERVIRARKKFGLSVTKTGLTSEAILAIPLVPANAVTNAVIEQAAAVPTPQPVVEKKRSRKAVAKSTPAGVLG